MPTLNLDPTIDTTAPGLAKRRVWCAPRVTSHSLITLTLYRLYLAPRSANPSVAAIQNGSDLDSIFGPHATIVDLVSIRRVRFDLIANTLTIDYANMGQTGRVVLEFADHEAADDVYTKIWRRLGDSVTLKQDRGELWQLARMPIALMAMVLIGVAFLSIIGTISAMDASVPWLNWRWICGFGGIILALVQVLLYRRLTTPPKSLELIRK